MSLIQRVENPRKEYGSPCSNSRTGMSYSLTDEFIVTLRIFYDDEFAQEFGSDSETRLNLEIIGRFGDFIDQFSVIPESKL